MALAFGKDRHQHIGASDLFATRRLNMNHGALNHPLESRSRFGIIAVVQNQAGQFIIDIAFKVPAQRVERVWIEGQLVYDIERERQRY